MESYLTAEHYDLVTPDGKITQIKTLDKRKKLATVVVEGISSAFVGYKIDQKLVSFNIKSTLAQLGLNGVGKEILLEPKLGRAEIQVELTAFGDLAIAMLDLLTPDAYIGKLFAADDRRKVREPEYLKRMFGRSDRKGRPLLSLGGLEGSGHLILETMAGIMYF